jgi:hypothetical protein
LYMSLVCSNIFSFSFFLFLLFHVSLFRSITYMLPFDAFFLLYNPFLFVFFSLSLFLSSQLLFFISESLAQKSCHSSWQNTNQVCTSSKLFRSSELGQCGRRYFIYTIKYIKILCAIPQTCAV